MGIRAQAMYRLNHQVVGDDTKIWFGKYKDTRMKDLPIKYKKWLRVNGRQNIKDYFKN